jgi:hypothetical protein
MKKASGKSNIQILRDYVDGIRPFTQVGFIGDKHKYRKEGERWKDGAGIEWEKQNGQSIRITKTQGDFIREIISQGQKCKCGQDIRWGSKLDRYFFSRTGLCENCLITYETNLRILGLYEIYERYKLISYEFGRLNEAREKIKEVIKFFKEDSGDVEMICNSEGFIERWKNTNTSKIKEDAEADLNIINERIEKLSKIQEEAKQLYIESVKPYDIEAYA